MELATIALAHVCFEKLILLQSVSKVCVAATRGRGVWWPLQALTRCVSVRLHRRPRFRSSVTTLYSATASCLWACACCWHTSLRRQRTTTSTRLTYWRSLSGRLYVMLPRGGWWLCLLGGPLPLCVVRLTRAAGRVPPWLWYGLRCEQRVPRKQMLKAEFSVFARLEFSLFVPTHEHDPHFKRLLRVRSRLPPRSKVPSTLAHRHCWVCAWMAPNSPWS